MMAAGWRCQGTLLRRHQPPRGGVRRNKLDGDGCNDVTLAIAGKSVQLVTTRSRSW